MSTTNIKIEKKIYHVEEDQHFFLVLKQPSTIVSDVSEEIVFIVFEFEERNIRTPDLAHPFFVCGVNDVLNKNRRIYHLDRKKIHPNVRFGDLGNGCNIDMKRTVF